MGDGSVNVERRGDEPDKVAEAILLLVSEAELIGRPLSQFDALSALFLADRGSVDRRGATITGDDHVAMPQGPVGSRAYDLLKSTSGAAGLPWSRTPQPGRRAVLYHTPSRPVHHAAFSRSEAAELAAAFATVKALGYGDTLALTVTDEDYRLARASSRSRATPFTMKPRAGRLAAAAAVAIARPAGRADGQGVPL